MMLAAAFEWESLFFVLFALVACVFAVAVVFTSNIVRMAFYLTLSLGSTAGLFFLAGAEFVGAMQLMIYVGGTLVLLIFGVMLTAQARFVSMKTAGGEWVLAVILGSGLLLLLVQAAMSVGDWRTAHPYPRLARAAGQFEDAAEGLREIARQANEATADDRGLNAGRVARMSRQQALLADQVAAARTEFAELAPGAVAPLERAEQLLGRVGELLAALGGQASQADRLRELGIGASDAAAQLAAASSGLSSVAQQYAVPVDASQATTQIGLAFAGPRVDKLQQPDPELRRGMSGYLLPFVIVSVHLLVVLVGAAYMARTKRRASASVR